MRNSSLLTLLAGGDYVSGQQLAEALGVSRTAVWKQLGRLGELGLEVESARGRGYRIPGGLELLQAEQVRAAMSPGASELLGELDIRDSVGSTNAETMARLVAGCPPGYVCAAERQEAGRGRRGREWVSPFAHNLYFSIAWQFAGGAAALEGLSLAVGVAVARALRRAGLPTVQLKWPNDILHADAKLGGVLLEMAGDAAGPCQVVVGVGLNVRMPESSAGQIEQAWTDVARASGGSAAGRNVLLGLLLDELLPLLAGFERQGFAHWREEWQSLDAFADRGVVLHSGEHSMAGTARGVDERGALRLETGAAGLQLVFGGEISLRPAR